MLKVLIPTIMLIPAAWTINKKWMWTTITYQSFFISAMSLIWLKWDSETGWSALNPYLGTDQLSTPLLILSCWLLPLTIMASQNHMKKEPTTRQRTYITLLISLQMLLTLAFGATEIIMFYIMFEATLIPTLIIITRWGNQMERLNAGTYFLFYTLTGSLPLLVALLILQKELGTLSMLIIQYNKPFDLISWGDKMWWVACLVAFLVKMPLYGVHLWLPKAHVEAPVAGSMILAAVLLKLGGYGMMRIMVLLDSQMKELSYPFIVLALWGIIMTGSICLRQTDLKSMIAYSSVSHMGLVAAGIFIQTPWGFTGAIILMIAHGLVSSALFCLANTNYERTHSRTLLLARGLQTILPLMASWWFIMNLANLALPPLPNLMGEIMIITAMFNWSYWSIIITGLGTLITAGYSLYMFLMTQRGPTPNHITNLEPSHSREHLLISMHLIPVILLILNPMPIWGAFL
uniref:NADH-ubiquinone oxidoreductase chain 4 n=1 Tax=Conger japonicus TaxID=86968 RepID=A0A0F7LE30_CONJA|nr:NADH dehydrogenase subunit 4 [Conger erebennus]AKH60654.1 NADH dehydrogenase subunit 4 [Conger japonicus]UNH92411.1 NADH dehydrogenase subunit 4 [Conger erebennus]